MTSNWGIRLIVVVALAAAVRRSGCVGDETTAESPASSVKYLSVATELLWETQDVVGIAISANGPPGDSTLFVTFYDGSVLEVDRESGEPIRKLSFGVTGVSQFCISPRGTVIGIVSEVGEAAFWDVTANNRVVLPDFMDDRITAICMSSNGQAAFACVGGKIKVCELNSDADVFVLEGHQATCRAVAYSPDGSSLASGADDGRSRFGTLQNGQSDGH